MDTLLQVLMSGLTLGAMYAVGAIGLALVWGSLGMLNMAHGVLLTIGGYTSYAAITSLGLPILFPLCWFYGRFKHSRSPGSLWRFL
jgi:branched-subunit amino acid ABC-type transport system permease component